jgi:hypothetical protein
LRSLVSLRRVSTKQATKELRYATVKLKAFFLHLNDADSSDDASEKKSRSTLRYTLLE